MDLDEKDPDYASEGNPVTSVRHLTSHSTNACLGLMVWIWCPGCKALHSPRFRCPEHGGPPDGPVWDGDPNVEPFSMSPSYMVHGTSVSPNCHSFIRNGQWLYLADCTHELAGKTVRLQPLPDWLVKSKDPED